MATITTYQNFPTSKQVPDHAIMDLFGKQVYLGNQFSFCTTTISVTDTSENTVLYLLNPASASKSLFVHQRGYAGADLTNTVTYRLYSNPTSVTSGTAKTANNCRPASSNTSGATLKQAPSVVTKGTLLETIPVGPVFAVSPQQVLYILDPGQALLITAQASGQPTSALAQLVWYEL